MSVTNASSDPPAITAKVSKNVEFEYGVGLGLGAVFGDLENTWVREDPNGSLVSENGRRFTRCEVVAPDHLRETVIAHLRASLARHEAG